MALKIALVEDDSSIRAMFEYYFKSLGHEIAAFESGEDFFAASPKADLALLDVMLPGMAGRMRNISWISRWNPRRKHWRIASVWKRCSARSRSRTVS